jgi:hypothetical protein
VSYVRYCFLILGYISMVDPDLSNYTTIAHLMALFEDKDIRALFLAAIMVHAMILSSYPARGQKVKGTDFFDRLLIIFFDCL